MKSPQLKTQQGAAITDWRNWSQPKAANQWKAGRSAMELARAWFTSPVLRCPPEIEALLATHPLTAGIEFSEGVAEFVTGFRGGSGGRNHDLLLRGQSGGHQIVVSIEGKADETFGNDTIGSYYRKAKASQSSTKADKRIEGLLEMLFGAQARADQLPWSALRYQLLTGVAATAVQAAKEGAPYGVFLVHEFHNPLGHRPQYSH